MREVCNTGNGRSVRKSLKEGQGGRGDIELHWPWIIPSFFIVFISRSQNTIKRKGEHCYLHFRDGEQRCEKANSFMYHLPAGQWWSSEEIAGLLSPLSVQYHKAILCSSHHCYASQMSANQTLPHTPKRQLTPGSCILKPKSLADNRSDSFTATKGVCFREELQIQVFASQLLVRVRYYLCVEKLQLFKKLFHTLKERMTSLHLFFQ